MNLKENELWEAWGKTNALYTQWCSRQGMNSYRQLVLYAINGHEPTTQKQIADCTGLSKQTVSTVMRDLKSEGLAVLSESEGDRREKYVHLTEKGTYYVQETLGPLYAMERRVYEILGSERMKQLMDGISLFNLVFEKEMGQNYDADK